ncbi:thermonuclease family protein [Oleidesulfovibrio sp.]|uniref:thermonuclease family protein n=1 Tax=Oleidesulfovibrio sp. TaxID=2909707 RepID=UPI003A85562F
MLARSAKSFVKRLVEGRQVRLSNIRRGKYFRLIAQIQIDGKDLAQMLLDAGLAVPYEGKKRPDHTILLHPPTSNAFGFMPQPL